MNLFHRRDFLRLGAASLVAPTFSQLVNSQEKASPFGAFTVGVQSYTFREFTLEQTLKKCKDLGITYAEFYRGHIPTNSTPDQIKATLKLCNEYGVKPIAFGVERFTKNTDDNKKLFEFGAALGIKHLSADPDPDSFDSLDKLVAEYKISIAIHPHGPTGKDKRHRWWSAENILEAVKDHNELIGTCLDTAHLIRMAQLDVQLDVAKQVKVMGKRNFGLHLKDHDNKKKTDVIFGNEAGVLKVAEVLKALQDVKFGGYIAIEYEANPKEPTKDVEACVKYLQTTIKDLK